MSWTEKLSVRIAKKLIPEGEAYTVAQVSHGIEIFLLYVINTGFLIAAALFLGVFRQAVVVGGVYLLLRNFTGGVHFKSARACFVAGNALLLSAALLVKHLPAVPLALGLLTVAGCCTVAIGINARYAPARHTYISIAEETRKRNKRIALILLVGGCILSELLVYFTYSHLAFACSFAVLLQAILLHPAAFRVVEWIEKRIQED